MDPSSAVGLAAVVVLVLLNGFFVATEFAIVGLSVSNAAPAPPMGRKLPEPGRAVGRGAPTRTHKCL